jgi:hypothetical protein
LIVERVTRKKGKGVGRVGRKGKVGTVGRVQRVTPLRV